jgi:serine/threonine protein kinase
LNPKRHDSPDIVSSDLSYQDDFIFREDFDLQSLIGHMIADKYRIDAYLGKGGFGCTFRGSDLTLQNRPITIKFLKLTHIDELQERRSRFEQEVNILCRLDHPNIPQIIDFLREYNAFIVKYVDGKSCKELLDQRRPLDEGTALAVAKSVCSAIVHTHRQGIAHRDVKPDNILIDTSGHVWLIDYGIAKNIEGTELTVGRAPLTYKYAAPERRSMMAFNPKLSDIYEIGATVSELATGLGPGLALKGPIYVMSGITKKRKHLTRSFRRFLRRTTEELPEKRYQTAEEMAEDLSKVKRTFKPIHLPWPVVVLTLTAIVAALAYWGSQFITLTNNQTPSETLGSHQSDQARSSPAPESTAIMKPRESSPAIESKTQPQPPFPEGSRESASSTQPDPRPNPPVSAAITPTLKVVVTQKSNTNIWVDDSEWTMETPLPLKRGTHEIRIENAGYPILKEPVKITSPLTYEKDLAKEFADRRTMRLIIGKGDKLQDAEIKMQLNGFERALSRTPDGMAMADICAGIWKISFSARGRGGELMTIDSVVIFPYGGESQPRKPLPVKSAEVDFGSSEWRDLTDIDITVF